MDRYFAVCPIHGTRQRAGGKYSIEKKEIFESLSCAPDQAHGKDAAGKYILTKNNLNLCRVP